MDRVADVGRGAVLEDVAFHIEVEGFVEEILLAVHREEDDPEGVSAALAFAGDVHAAHARHVHVEKEDIHFQLPRLFERIPAVAGFMDQFESGVRREHAAQAVAVDRVVVGEDDSNFWIHGLEMGDRDVECQHRSLTGLGTTVEMSAEQIDALPEARQAQAVGGTVAAEDHLRVEAPPVVLDDELESVLSSAGAARGPSEASACLTMLLSASWRSR